MCGTHAVVQPMLHRDVAVSVAFTDTKRPDTGGGKPLQALQP
jgi:hypothetical protein